MKKKIFCILIILGLTVPTFAGLDIVRSNGITLTGADGINYIGTSGITLTGADGLGAFRSNGITLTGADGITLTGADGITLTGADGSTYVGQNGITLTGADGITLTGADGITLTGADGITLTGADGTRYRADSFVITRPDGITLTGADGITLTGADGITLTGADGAARVGTNGITLTGADGITLTGADGITLTGADGITLTGADSVAGFGPSGLIFEKAYPAGITLTGADGITLTGADGITLTGADGIAMRNIDGITLTGADNDTGLQSVDPELAVALNNATDDSNINAVVVYHDAVTDDDISQLRQFGFAGGTRFRALPIVYVTGTRDQIIAISRLRSVRSIYGNRTLTLNADPYFKVTGIDRVPADRELTVKNNGMPFSGRNVTVAVLDTGINGDHGDLSGRVIQNVRLADLQSIPAGFTSPTPVEGLRNTDPVAGHGTFVAGVVAGSGGYSAGKYAGIAPGAKLLGLSAGDLNLISVLSGYEYILQKGSAYNVRVVNCSFSANAVYDENDPVNVATKMLTDRGVNVVFSAGNAGPGNGSLNPYAMAPWVISVGSSDEKGTLAKFSSRGSFTGLGRPTVVAPGINIASIRNAPTTTSVGGLAGADAQRLTFGEVPFYTTASGTSFSAPQVAGAIALMLEANPNLSPADIKDILSRTATPLPRYFSHEVGAGMLNTYGSVIEAAFPERRLGIFRSGLSSNKVRFSTQYEQVFADTVVPGAPRSFSFGIPEDAVEANFGISWGLSPNDFGLRLYNPDNSLAGESNNLNLTGLTGRSESVTLRSPRAQSLRASMHHTGGVGVPQSVLGSVELTRIEYPDLVDLKTLSSSVLADVERSIVANILLAEGKKFRPDSAMSRSELAATFVRAGLVPQYVASAPMYHDVRDPYTRNVVESVQSCPNGKLFVDATDRFGPHASASRLATAVSMVKAANLESLTSSTPLPATILDATSIPVQLRGYVAVALHRGFLKLDANRFNPDRPVTRLEVAQGINLLIKL